MCPSDNKKLFDLSGKAQANSVNELTESLKTILRQLKNDKTVIRSSAEQTLPIVISKNKLHEEKDRLKKFCQKEVDKFLKKKKNNSLLQRGKNLMKI